MLNIKLMNKISATGTDLFDREKYSVGDEIANPDAILVRSAALHDMEFGADLKAIARAGAGVNNIPIDRCSENGIVVFNTPGANSNGVKELVLAALIFSSRNVLDASKWAEGLTENVAKSVEKGKSQFTGHEIKGKKLGVIGLGAIGRLVANAAVELGMEVIGYDKFITVDGAWSLSRMVKKAAAIEDIFKSCDYITVHVPLTDETKDMFCSESFAIMKDGVRIMNFSRAGLVNAAALKEALASGKVAGYVTDFPTEETLGTKGIINIPHLGATTEESEENCAMMAARELIDFLENGNIKNSVNFPDVSLEHSGDYRICLFHKNVPNMLAKISGVVSELGINIENMINRSKKDWAYTMVETTGQLPADSIEKLKSIDGMARVTIIH